MYRMLFRGVCAAGNPSLIVFESIVSTAKCDKASLPVFRFIDGGGVKGLSTSAHRLCEKKDGDSIQDEKTNLEKDSCPTDNPADVPKQQEQSVLFQAADDGATEQQVEVKSEQVPATEMQVQTVLAKSGKESLLDLLGAMKVDVTSKRRPRNLKVKQNYTEAAQAKSKPVMESTISSFQKAMEEASSQSETLDPSLVSAASAAASTLPNKNQAESELLRQLRKRKAMSEAQKNGDLNNLGVIITDMKVGKTPHRQNTSASGHILFDDDDRGYRATRGVTFVLSGVHKRGSLISGNRLNIFSPITETDALETTGAQPTLWDVDFAHQMSQSLNQMPRNAIEEMILWTKEGKMWQYPINNEAGLEEEASVPFHEHVFLEKHLEEGFPRQGPVRHFMELVVAGLSKNPYLTVEQKKEHIFWFRDYFQQKEEALNEADVYLQ